MLELIFQGFMEWAYGLALECWEYFSSSLLDIIPDCGIYYASLGRASASEQERSEIMQNLDQYALCMVSFGQEAIKDA